MQTDISNTGQARVETELSTGYTCRERQSGRMSEIKNVVRPGWHWTRLNVC